VAGEILEDRSVPSGVGGFLGNLIGSVPAQDARLVQQAFGTFERSYFQAVRNDLLQATPNPAQFSNTDVPAAFTALNSSINMDIQNLLATSANANLGSTLQGAVSALQTQLNGLMLPTTSSSGSVRNFMRMADRAINLTASQAAQQVRSAAPPTGSVDAQTLGQDLSQVFMAFQRYNQAYTNAIQTDLLAAGTTNPSSNSTKFNADVSSALSTLVMNVTQAQSMLPSSLMTTLTMTLTNDLTGSSTTRPSLQTNLQSLALPQSTNFFPLLLFRFQSAFTIAGGEGQVIQDIVTAVRQFNTTLSG